MEDEVDKWITIAAILIGYPKDAILFVLSGWSEFEVLSQSHIDGEKLCWRLHDYALSLYGENAREKLGEWNITTTSDFGKIVFGLAEHGLLGTSETDDLTDFDNVFDFKNQFVEPKFTVTTPTYQWRLSTLFACTTLCAIAISGFTRHGFDGVFTALLSSWFAILGLSCVIIGITSRLQGWLFLLCFGIVSLAAGLLAFFTLSYW